MNHNQGDAACKCEECMSKAQGPCWDGYVQRGMKEKDGNMVPNCIPVEKTIFENLGKDYTKSQPIDLNI